MHVLISVKGKVKCFPMGHADARVHVFTASALGSGTVLTPHSAIFTLEKTPVYTLQEAESTPGEAMNSAHFQTFRHFTYVTANSPNLTSLYLRHSSFSNPSVASPTSRFILQPFFRFSYVTGSSHMSPSEPPMHPSSARNGTC